MKKGIFIVIEGIDGSGKSTVTQQLGNLFIQKGYNVWITAEPTKERYGQILREKLRDKTCHPIEESLLFALDRFQHNQSIQEHLNKGEIVISDRYTLSSYAYQTITLQKFGYTYTNALNWLFQINQYNIHPDVLVYLQITPEMAMERIQKMGKVLEKYENLSFLYQLSEYYNIMIQNEEKMYPILRINVLDYINSLLPIIYTYLLPYIGGK